MVDCQDGICGRGDTEVVASMIEGRTTSVISTKGRNLQIRGLPHKPLTPNLVRGHGPLLQRIENVFVFAVC